MANLFAKTSNHSGLHGIALSRRGNASAPLPVFWHPSFGCAALSTVTLASEPGSIGAGGPGPPRRTRRHAALMLQAAARGSSYRPPPPPREGRPPRADSSPTPRAAASSIENPHLHPELNRARGGENRRAVSDGQNPHDSAGIGHRRHGHVNSAPESVPIAEFVRHEFQPAESPDCPCGPGDRRGGTPRRLCRGPIGRDRDLGRRCVAAEW